MKLPQITHEMRSRFKDCPRKLYWPHVAGITHRDDYINEDLTKKFRDAIRSIRQGTPKDEILESSGTLLTSYLQDYLAAFTIETENIMTPRPISLGDEIAEIHGIKLRHNGSILLIDRIDGQTDTPDIAFKMDEEILHLAGAVTLSRLSHEGRPVRITHALVRNINFISGTVSEQKVSVDMQMVERHWKLKTETNHVMRMMSENVHDIDSWPWNFKTCTNKRGQCPYMGLCSQTKETSFSNFTYGQWEPLDNGQQRKQQPNISATATVTNT